MKRCVFFAVFGAVFGAVLLAASPASAHRPSDSTVRLVVTGDHIAARWDIAVRDLDSVLGLDAGGDRTVSGGELRAAWPRIAAYALPRLTVTADGVPCRLALAGHDAAIAQHSDGAYAVLALEAVCPDAPRMLGVEYRLFFDVDPQHRGLVTVAARGESHTGILRADAARADFAVMGSSAARELAGMIWEGVLHIWAGTDHILFLIALLLPSLLGRDERRPLASILKVVTGFTVAHSITLALAGLGLVSLPPRFVETAIAVTVVIAALQNLRAGARARWQVAFCLGLLHGFGFANVLGDLGISGGRLALTLLGFNVGVELGQAAIVLGVLPIAYALRATSRGRRAVLVAGSAAIAAVALFWAVERFTA
jgi:hypothetical protein